MTEATKVAGKAVRQGQEAVRETAGTAGKALPELPTGQLTSSLQNLAAALADRALSSVTGKVEGLTGRLNDFADGGTSSLMGAITGSDKSIGASALTGAVKGILGGKGKGGKAKGKKFKATNIVETIDIGAPRRMVYDQWTEFQDFPSFMKKVENVDQESDEKLSWTAQVLWSHRTWRSTILEQVPDERIIWRSEGAKGYVDGTVSFHALTPDFTRVMMVLEYHPQGFFEHTGNLWRAQGRRARLELKHFARHVMTHVMVKPDETSEMGWRGEIHDSEVVKDHETALAEERKQAEAGAEEGEFAEEEEEPQPEVAYEEEEPEEEEREEPRRRAETVAGPPRPRRSEEEEPVRRSEEEPARPVRRGAASQR
ncbi:SRPBCC family protein [Nonomuraea sp. K274]|uniref:SRPBCC family protein n=1 Tax=Nonomuraea cypriaca TaxID=1187855 RepID=A0A931F1H7_9ACTN|nr:SRPBCC family protein [Nonomuraea cypriaca]MBF8189622.1 SRPBCC family protein [Nonomuraea cypriaca]